MKKVKRKTQGLQPKPISRSALVKEISQSHLASRPFDKKVLKRALTDLSTFRRRKEVPAKSYCQLESLKEKNVDHQVKLRCRQLPSVVHQLRKAVLRQDWDEVTTLLIILCHPGLKHYISIIMKVCFILLFHHSSSNIMLLQNFIRHATEYILEEDVNKFIKILFALRKSPLIPLKCGKYVRKTRDYKVTRDVEFEKL